VHSFSSLSHCTHNTAIFMISTLTNATRAQRTVTGRYKATRVCWPCLFVLTKEGRHDKKTLTSSGVLTLNDFSQHTNLTIGYPRALEQAASALLRNTFVPFHIGLLFT